ncbi:response regulator transcription factor [Colwellia sp. MB02u-18]|uniref:response regulator n=1 Tax=unclassified Colwellia TaxID=196834 RepID=UPI0015F5BAF1|nr:MULTISPECIES: response regulator transcription factor [unclassified Colwellia]MBA6225318.1 response regulator transcription factor [Colwellia sp. MB3u-45]MBA6267232.1 response regulator transcription factor [Colwellia sp. MB3u-43]MBA6322844.1 response regulator transcription factor [Colwellia sp. MB02u-19]MBA6324748.1 response regulator transcription factor [Colwellia sp. MB02u-18]MBA6331061.1 response regulator transcription factor [Colwellia sp. MB02u-12]
MRILLVEDDLPLAQALQQSLRHEGFLVNHVDNGEDALTSLTIPDHDMVILDLGLPDMDGLLVLKKLRAKKKTTPVIVLTARDTIEQRVQGLDFGADDYLIKPFDINELLARLRVIERRLGTADSAIISIALVKLDTTAHKVFIEDKELSCSKKEYMVLKVLMENAGRIQSREQIESRLYDWGEEVMSNAVEVHIHNLRKKLPEKFIQTVRGVGYTINKA